MEFGQALYNYTLNSTGDTETSSVFKDDNGDILLPEDIIDIDICESGKYISKLGIRAEPGTEFNINGNNIMIGNSCLYEVNDAIITSLKIVTPTSQIMINYVTEDGGNN